jgi:predicted enzyme related to lactoylglutathione lyase
MTRPTGAPCWMDLLTSDTERATRFYTNLFGWTAGEGSPEFGGYFMFMKDSVPVAGGMRNQPGMGYPDGWSVYLSAADAKSTADKALKHGGTLREGPMDIADLGTEAVLTDAFGARIGAWQAKAFPGFAEYAGQPGTPAYFELLTRDYQGAVAFYRDVFGWDGKVMSDTPEFRLTALRAGDVTVAGIMDATAVLPHGEDNHWNVYLKVADTDAALARITELGGTVTEPPVDTPYGRLAGAADPVGARFKLVG